jgi:hypothetical protein
MLGKVALLSIFALVSILVQRCSTETCTLVGCGTSFEVGFTGETGKPGRYQVDVVADGVPSTCELTLPKNCESQPTCSSVTSSWGLMLSGCAAGDPQSIDGVAFHGQAPLTVDLVVRRDGAVVGQASVRPDYQESRPNGPQCDPVCRSAPRFETALAP